MITARDAAEYFLRQADEDSGDLMSNLKLQKLVYFAQCVHLAGRGKPLFSEPIEAWPHGPVVESLYHYYKKCGGGAIDPDPDYELPDFNDREQETLDEVYRVLGQYSAWKLRAMTHEEAPWINAYNKCSGSEISRDDMAAYFKPYVKVT